MPNQGSTQSVRHAQGGLGDPGPSHAPASEEFAPGTLIGDYELRRFIGAGGMGEVHEARRSGREVRYAIKILAPTSDDREGRLHEMADHPHVVAIHDRGTFLDGKGRRRHFLVMRLVRGARSLTAYADHHRLGLEARVSLLVQACRAVESFHPKVCHFDLKPANILVGDDGVVQVSDLGLARLATDLALVPPGGTTAYASPEQLTLPVADLDHRADQYALGASLYELVTGRPPVVIRSDMSVADALEAKRSSPAPLWRTVPEADRELDAIVRRALQFSRDARFASAAAFREALEVWLARRATLGFRARRWMGRRRVRASGLVALGTLVGSLLGAMVLAPLVRPLVRWESSIPVPTAPLVTPLERVRVVTLPADEREIEALAARLQIADVRAVDRRSWRRLHARILETVAGRASAVVFDIAFSDPDPADEALAEAVRTCTARGTPVVFCSERRAPDANGMPQVSPALWRAGGTWGYSTLLPQEDERSIVPLMTIDRDGECFPSLSLAAAAAVFGQGAQPEYSLTDENQVRTRYWIPGERPGSRRVLQITSTTIPSVIQPWAPSLRGQELGFGAGDRLALLRVDVPDASFRSRSTITAADLLTDAARVAAVSEKVVLIADPERDWQVAADPSPAYLHAAAIDTLLGGRGLVLWAGPGHLGPIVAMGVLGAALGAAWPGAVSRVTRRPIALFPGLVASAPARWGVLALVCAGAWELSASFARSAGILLSPVPACCSLIAAAEITAPLALLVFPPPLRKESA